MDESRKVQMTAAEVARFHEEGLVVPDYRIPQPLLDRMRAEVDTLIERNPGVRPEQLSGAHNPWGQSSRLMGTQTFLDFCMFPEILDLVEQLIGPDIVLWGSMLLCKPAGVGRAVPGIRTGSTCRSIPWPR